MTTAGTTTTTTTGRPSRRSALATLALSVVLMLALALPAAADEHTHHYKQGDDVVVWLNTVGPLANKQETYEYMQLPYCLGPKAVTHYHESLGEALLGLELTNAGMDVRFNEPATDEILCQQDLDKRAIQVFRYAVIHSYYFSSFIDNLPLKSPVGGINKTDISVVAFIYTHREYTIGINKDQIVTVDMSSAKPVYLEPSADNIPIKFTYSVNWVSSNYTFETRFDRYLESDFFEHKIHWFSIFNSFMMVIFLVGVVIVILMRTLKRDFARYQHEEGLLDMDRDLGDEYGWKLVHGDVFRPPPHLTFFSALNGAGLQLVFMAFFVIMVTIMGNLYIERATMLTASIFIYALTSIIAGYYSGSMYTKHNGRRWVRNMIVVALFWPGVVSLTAFLINFVAIHYQSSRAIPFTTMIAILSIWLFLVFPLTLLGTIVGRNWSGTPKFPCRVNPIPRPIPDKIWYADSLFIVAAGGILPFGAVFIELYFVFTSFWEYKIYYVYGFMLLIYTILLVVTACVAIIATYFLLNSEDHRWHWTIFASSGSTAVYIFLYSIYYFNSVTRMYGVFQTVWYFGYTALTCFSLFCMLGSVGYWTAARFVRSIYSNVKVTDAADGSGAAVRVVWHGRHAVALAQ
ncbi:Endomembrane protein 70-domain-containing protein [Entophlyctis helioformis]|nr:Endomembrane protein 70-domain-containing protein [Entophlyctis helioformis]